MYSPLVEKSFSSASQSQRLSFIALISSSEVMWSKYREVMARGYERLKGTD